MFSSAAKKAERIKQLIAAVEANDLQKAEALLKGKFGGIGAAHPNDTNEHGFAPLHFVQSAEMVDLLCKHEADVNRSTAPRAGSKWYPIHAAPNEAVTGALIAHGANRKVMYGGSNSYALHFAKTPGQVDLLVQDGGIDLINVRNMHDHTPLDSAQSPEVQERIKHYGGKTADELKQEHQELVNQKKDELSKNNKHQTGLQL